MKASVILCTLNPRREYLAQVLSALQRQTLPSGEWELIAVDNRSDSHLEKEISLPRGVSARWRREEQLGLLPARIRGASEAKGELLVFVDDDNVLASEYLAEAVSSFAAMEKLGAAGGRITPLFEETPPPWLFPWRNYLALRDFGTAPIFSEGVRWGPWCPIGAGLVVKRRLFAEHVQNLSDSDLRMSMGRRGESLASAEDADLVYSLLRRGHMTAYLPTLRLQHLISHARLRFSYISRLVRSIKYSNRRIRQFHAVDPETTSGAGELLRILHETSGLSTVDRWRALRIYFAGLTGEWAGFRDSWIAQFR